MSGIAKSFLHRAKTLDPLMELYTGMTEKDIVKSGGCTNIVFEGGGVKGIAHVGALTALEKYNIRDKLTHFAGTSAGSINATLAAIKVPAKKIREILEKNSPSTLLCNKWGVFRDIINLYVNFGWNKNSNLLKFVENKVLQPYTGIKNITFQQIYEKYGSELYITATNISLGNVEVFSRKTHPNQPVNAVVVASSSNLS